MHQKHPVFYIPGARTDRQSLAQLSPGDGHYMAYVGPPLQYDLLGAMQFRLLTAFGLRAHHKILDFGCGSLRAGRLLIPYLDRGNYYGVEPNDWLVREGIENQVGDDLVRIKQPVFSASDDFTADLGTSFDYIVAQSIFSHTGKDLISKLLESLAECLKPDGLLLATFVLTPRWGKDTTEVGWVYPNYVAYRPHTVQRLASAAGLHAVRLRWRHPRQTWYALARDRKRLPSRMQRWPMSDQALDERCLPLFRRVGLQLRARAASHRLKNRLWRMR